MADITARALMVTGAMARDKVYDGGTTATINGEMLNGVVGAEVVNLEVTALFADKDAGADKEVAVTYELGGVDAGNYMLATNVATLRADITARALMVTGAMARDKVYDGDADALVAGGMLGGVAAGDAVTLDMTVAAFADKDAGADKEVAVTYELGGADAGNYMLATNVATLRADITARALMVTGAMARDKVYDGDADAMVAGGMLSVVVAGDAVTLAMTMAAFADKDAGAGKEVAVTYELGGADAGNYMLATNVATLRADITARALMVTGAMARDKVYDGDADALVAGGMLGGVAAGDAVTLAMTMAAFADKDAGAGKEVAVTYELGGADVGNYMLATNVATLRADITARALMVTGAMARDKVYDGDADALVAGGMLGGVVAGDSVTLDMTMAAFADKDAGAGKEVAVTYELGGADAGHYTVSGDALTADITEVPPMMPDENIATRTSFCAVTATTSEPIWKGNSRAKIGEYSCIPWMPFRFDQYPESDLTTTARPDGILVSLDWILGRGELGSFSL